MCKQAVIICGGKGKRLLPFTRAVPKGLITVGNTPILELIISQLRQAGFSQIIFAVNYFSHQIKSHFEDGTRWNLCLSYSDEDFPMGTAGPLVNIKNLQDNFLVMNCDILTNVDFETLFEYHIDSANHFTLAGYHKPIEFDLGLLHVDLENRLARMEEKPESILINSGIYVLNRSVVEYIPENRNFNMDELINRLLVAQRKVGVFPFRGYWKDIGTFHEYQSMLKDIEIRSDLKNLFVHSNLNDV